MAKSAQDIDEMLVVPTSSSRAVIERVMIAFRKTDGCVITQPSAEVLHIAETTKRLLSRKTSVCIVTIVNEPQRLVVHISGQLRNDRSAALKAAIYGSSVDGLQENLESGANGWRSQSTLIEPVSASWSGGGQITPSPSPSVVSSASLPMSPHAPADVGRTELRPTQRNASDLDGGPPTGHRILQIQVADGRRFELGLIALLGRNPSGTSQDAGALLIALADDGVSKTHVAIGRQGDDAWVEDRKSTNGTTLIDQFGRELVLIPGQRMIFQPPARLQLGDTFVNVVRL